MSLGSIISLPLGSWYWKGVKFCNNGKAWVQLVQGSATSYICYIHSEQQGSMRWHSSHNTAKVSRNKKVTGWVCGAADISSTYSYSSYRYSKHAFSSGRLAEKKKVCIIAVAAKTTVSSKR